MTIQSLTHVLDCSAITFIAGFGILFAQSLAARLHNKWLEHHSPRKTQPTSKAVTTPELPKRTKPEPTYTDQWKASDLRREAARLGIRGAARMRKRDLLVALNG